MEDKQFQLIMNKLNEMNGETNERFDNLEQGLKETNNKLEQGLKETKSELQNEIKETKDELQKEIKNTKNTIKHVNIAAQGMIRLLQDDIGEIKHRLSKIEEKQNLHEHQMTVMMSKMTKGFKEDKEQISKLQKEYNQLLNI